MPTPTIEELEQPINSDVEPTDVLNEQMMFYRNKSLHLAKMIIDTIKANPKHRGDQLVQMYKLMSRAREMTIKVAAELAPYRKPKLQSVEVVSKVEHKFVIRSPEAISDTGDWLRAVGHDKEPLIISDEKKHAKLIKPSLIEYSDEDIIRLSKNLNDLDDEFPVKNNSDDDEFVEPEDRFN